MSDNGKRDGDKEKTLPIETASLPRRHSAEAEDDAALQAGDRNFQGCPDDTTAEVTV